jgi:riboflavin kinase / FMN adenylyltransferase
MKHEATLKIIGDVQEFEATGAVVSIGMFDGVHRGHRRVLQALRTTGRCLGLPTVVITFDPHPRAVLRPESAPAMLVSLEDRIELLTLTEAADHCLVLPFDRRASEEPAHDFVKHMLVGRLRMRALVVGDNFCCGRGRTGDIALLHTLGAELGFTVYPVALRSRSDSMAHPPCSSSEMRRLIQSGEIARASAGLARPHEMTGTVSRLAEQAGRVIEVTLPDGMCTPAADHYTGAVRNKHIASPWIPALLQVRHESGRRPKTVRLVASDDVPVVHGDVLALRFLERASTL